MRQPLRQLSFGLGIFTCQSLETPFETLINNSMAKLLVLFVEFLFKMFGEVFVFLFEVTLDVADFLAVYFAKFFAFGGIKGDGWDALRLFLYSALLIAVVLILRCRKK